MQVGPATEYAKSQSYWLVRVVSFQLIMLLARAMVVGDTIGSLWMGLTITIGVFAWQHQMNISYICAWGLLCGVNGTLDIIVFLGGVMRGESGMSLLIRVLVFISYLCGAALARHLYIDYALTENVPVREWSRICDPFGTFAAKFDKDGGTTDSLKANVHTPGYTYNSAAAAQGPPPSDKAAAYQSTARDGANQIYAGAAAGAAAAANQGQDAASAAREAAYAQYQRAAPANMDDPSRMQPVGSNPFMTGPLRAQDLP